ncbi:MAG: DUF6660 family protein [Salibacteraceae bacterium]
MKRFAIIMSLYFLGLTFFPCGDVHAEGEVHVEMAGSHDHEEGEDDCSPLCYCQCCHISLIMVLPSTYSFYQITETHYSNTYQSLIPDSPVESLFRPPQA